MKIFKTNNPVPDEEADEEWDELPLWEKIEILKETGDYPYPYTDEFGEPIEDDEIDWVALYTDERLEDDAFIEVDLPLLPPDDIPF